MLDSGRQHIKGYEPFDRYARRYDAWFEHASGRAIFPVEIASLRKVTGNPPKSWIEIGVGTGRFAHALGIEYGIDPSKEVLKLAKNRGVAVRHGFAENLPYSDSKFGAAFMIVTICFLSDPGKAISECARILMPGGSLIVGLVPKESLWGEMYAKKGGDGHPLYSVANFYTCQEVIAMAGTRRFVLEGSSSCLFEQPGAALEKLAPPRPGIIEGAGFVAMRFDLEKQ